MKTLLPLILILSCFFKESSAQSTCLPADEHLSINELNTAVNPLYLWWDRNNPQFNYPNGLPVHAVYAGGLWLTAQYPDGEVLSSVAEYGAATNLFDYQTGPVGTGGSFSSSNYFCRSFRVTKSQVGAHIADLADGTLDQPIPEIMDWPGRDNSLMPTTAMGRELAPFVDVNGDGIYQPENGDYPDFRADEAVWWVTNDFGPHLASDADLVGAEVQVLAQAFAAPDHPAARAQLYTVKVINKANVTLDSLGLSLWVDPDVGCPTDDAVGSIPSRNAMFAYNIDAVDGSIGASCEGGISTYADSPPKVVFQTLSSELNGVQADVRNSGISMNSAGVSAQTSDPNNRSDYFNLAHGRWLDGSPITIGGDGYGGTEPTNWIFSGVPEAGGVPWSECDGSAGGDRRLLLNVNMIDPFSPNDELTVDFLVSIVHNAQTYPCPDRPALVSVLDSITNYVQNTVVSTSRTPRNTIKELSLKPNPARNVCEISIGAGQEALQSATLFDGLGRVVKQYSSNELNGTINVAHLPRGTYSLVARDMKGEMYRSRVVLQ